MTQIVLEVIRDLIWEFFYNMDGTENAFEEFYVIILKHSKWSLYSLFSANF